MARLSLSLLVFIFIIMTSSSHGRKLLLLTNEHLPPQPQPPPPPGPTTITKLFLERLYMASLPKGTVPVSAPTKKGHAVTVDQKLIARHLRAIDRILYISNPTPGAGH